MIVFSAVWGLLLLAFKCLDLLARGFSSTGNTAGFTPHDQLQVGIGIALLLGPAVVVALRVERARHWTAILLVPMVFALGHFAYGQVDEARALRAASEVEREWQAEYRAKAATISCDFVSDWSEDGGNCLVHEASSGLLIRVRAELRPLQIVSWPVGRVEGGVLTVLVDDPSKVEWYRSEGLPHWLHDYANDKGRTPFGVYEVRWASEERPAHESARYDIDRYGQAGH